MKRIVVLMLVLVLGVIIPVFAADRSVYLPVVIRANNPPTPTPDREATATPQATPTPGGTPKPGDNLLVNPSFEDGFNGWTSVHGLWLIHGPLCHQNTAPFYAEMDIDACEFCDTWEVGDEDWLRQDVAAPAHTTVTVGVNEAHHMHSGDAIVRLYGSESGESWSLVWQRDAPDAEFGAGHMCTSPGIFSYEIAVSYPYYRLEIYGRMNEKDDGWLIGGLSLTVD